jgi:DNA-binding transcriptional regulator YhcF (GntR family)
MTDKAEKTGKAPAKIAERWGKDLTDAGWTALPTVIIHNQRGLGLDAVDMNILLHIVSYWWEPGNLPFPSKKTMAEAMDVDPRTVQRHIARLETAKLIKRIPRSTKASGQKSNQYELSGLIKEAAPFAKATLKQIADRQAQQQDKAKLKAATKAGLLKVLDGGKKDTAA